jgi:hypothetical protein
MSTIAMLNLGGVHWCDQKVLLIVIAGALSGQTVYVWLCRENLKIKSGRTSAGSQLPSLLAREGDMLDLHWYILLSPAARRTAAKENKFTAPVPQSIFLFPPVATHPSKKTLLLPYYCKYIYTENIFLHQYPTSACIQYNAGRGTRDRCVVGQSIWTICSVHARYVLYYLLVRSCDMNIYIRVA